MQKYTNAIQDVHGNAVAGATIAVYLYGTLTPATIYSDNGSTVIASSSVTSDSTGEFYFYAANGRYTLSVSAPQFASEQVSDVYLYDPTVANVVDTFTATAGQTVFTLTSAPGDIDALTVILNGASLTPTSEYTLSGVTLTLVLGAAAGDTLVARYGLPTSQQVIADGAVTDASVAPGSVLANLISQGPIEPYVNIVTATAGQTAFSLSFNPGSLNNLHVTLNGSKLQNGVDFTWASTTVTLATGAAAGDVFMAQYTRSTSVSSVPSGSVLDVSVATGSKLYNRINDWVSVKDFGADPTGVADSTAAIVAALATGHDVLIPDGTYRLAPTAVQNIANNGYQRLYGEGSVTLSVNLASSIDLFSFAGPVSLENLTIDFNASYCRYAFKWAASVGHVRVSNVRVRNLKDTDSTTGSITFWLISTGNTFEFAGVKAYLMLKRGNGTIGDAAGSYNLIYVGGGTGATQGSVRDVFVSDIHNINASDQVIYEDTAGIYVQTDSSDTANRVEISDVSGVNFGKRLLKIHASNVNVDGVTGYSTEGDSLGVIGFITGQTFGDKYGCSASNVRAYGNMEAAFFNDAPGTRWKNVIASVQPGTKAGMTNSGFGLLVSGESTEVDGFTCDSERIMAIGSAASVLNDIRLSNLNITLNSTVTQGIRNDANTLGFDGLVIENLSITVASSMSAATVPVDLSTYLNGTTIKGRNVSIRNVQTISAGPANAYCLSLKYIENASLRDFFYGNTSGNTHFRLAIFDTCANVNVDSVTVEGANTIGVYLVSCTGYNTVNQVQNTSATIAAVYNSNSSNVTVNYCDPAKVSGVTTATWINSKLMTGTTANRPTTGLVTGVSQYFDTTLGKPIWRNGANWVDATGATV